MFVCTHCLLETDGHQEQAPAPVPLLILPSLLFLVAKQGHAAPALLCSSHVGVQPAPRVRGSTSAKRPHSTTAPCTTGRIKPFVHDCICATATYLQFLVRFLFPFFLFLKDNFVRNTETKPVPWLVWDSPAAWQMKE